MKLNTTIINGLDTTKRVNKVIEIPDLATYKEVEGLHEILSNIFPDSHINFTWKPEYQEKNNHIFGQAVNEKKDIENPNISMTEYTNKWYKEQPEEVYLAGIHSGTVESV